MGSCSKRHRSHHCGVGVASDVALLTPEDSAAERAAASPCVEAAAVAAGVVREVIFDFSHVDLVMDDEPCSGG